MAFGSRDQITGKVISAYIVQVTGNAKRLVAHGPFFLCEWGRYNFLGNQLTAKKQENNNCYEVGSFKGRHE
jgi:hypothetical protein